MNKIKILLLSFLLNFLVFSSFSFSEIIKKIEITGNNRISDETILMFSKIDTGQSINNNKIKAINILYQTKLKESTEISEPNIAVNPKMKTIK